MGIFAQRAMCGRLRVGNRPSLGLETHKPAHSGPTLWPVKEGAPATAIDMVGDLPTVSSSAAAPGWRVTILGSLLFPQVRVDLGHQDRSQREFAGLGATRQVPQIPASRADGGASLQDASNDN